MTRQYFSRGPAAWMAVATLMASGPAADSAAQEGREAMLARAAEAELDTEYEAPPGDPLWHHTAGFAKTLCSAVFVTGLDPAFAAQNVGFFSGPYEQRRHVTGIEVDQDERRVRLTLPDGVVRTAKFNGDHGCVALPIDAEDVFFEPVDIPSALPDPWTQMWPMGDAVPNSPLAEGVDAAKVAEAVDAAFDPPEGLTAAFVVTHRGPHHRRALRRRHRPAHPARELVDGQEPHRHPHGGAHSARRLRPLAARPGARVADRGRPPARPSASPTSCACRAACASAASPTPTSTPPSATPTTSTSTPAPSTRSSGRRPARSSGRPTPSCRYRNSDPVLTNYLVRLGVEGRGDDYLSFPQRELFDKIGIRGMVLETDPYGNYLLQGYELAPARDWARLGNLYLQDGVWNGERILPEGYAEFVSTIAPAWQADGRPIYGGFFWINTTGTFPVPRDAYYMSGAGGQTTLIVPSHDLVVVRQGHYAGAGDGGRALRNALALLMEAIPASE